MIVLKRLAGVLLASLSLASCSHGNSAQLPDPQTILQAIPPADAAKYTHVQDMKKWKNPYLIVRANGVALFDVDDSAEIVLKNEELLPALAKLPAADWPYGRVVAAAESQTNGSEQDKVALRKNKGIVGGMLEGAHITVDWVPST